MRISRLSAIRISIALPIIAIIIAVATACPARDAAVAINKYGNTLEALQKGEVVAYKAVPPRVSDVDHIKIQSAIKVASSVGHALDQCALTASKGGDTAPCVAKAQATYNEVIALVVSTHQDDLIALGNAAGAALQNAISVIQSIHAQPVKPISETAPSPNRPTSGLALWLGFGMLGIVATGAGSLPSGVVQLLNLIIGLEPVGFDLLLKLADKLQGKTPEEIVAMNEDIFNRIDTTADAEIAATKAKIASESNRGDIGRDPEAAD